MPWTRFALRSRLKSWTKVRNPCFLPWTKFPYRNGPQVGKISRNPFWLNSNLPIGVDWKVANLDETLFDLNHIYVGKWCSSRIDCTKPVFFESTLFLYANCQLNWNFLVHPWAKPLKSITFHINLTGILELSAPNPKWNSICRCCPVLDWVIIGNPFCPVWKNSSSSLSFFIVRCELFFSIYWISYVISIYWYKRNYWIYLC